MVISIMAVNIVTNMVIDTVIVTIMVTAMDTIMVMEIKRIGNHTNVAF